MTTQLYPQIRTSAIRERIAAFCEDRGLDLSIRFIITLMNDSSFPVARDGLRACSPLILYGERFGTAPAATLQQAYSVLDAGKDEGIAADGHFSATSA